MKRTSLLLVILLIICSTVKGDPCYPPSLTNAPDSIVESHCNILTFDFDGQLYVLDDQSNPLLFYSNIGEIDSLTGVWNYEPLPEDVNDPPTLEIYISNGSCEDTTAIPLVITNDVPEVINIPAYFNTGEYRVHNFDLDAIDNDMCDSLIWSVKYHTGGMILNLDSLTGQLSILTLFYPADPYADILLSVTDGIDTVDFNIQFMIIYYYPNQIKIEQLTDAVQGKPVDVGIDIGFFQAQFVKFNLSVAYEKEVLNLFKVIPSDELMNQCNWEYFTYKIILDNPDPDIGVVKITMIGSLTSNYSEIACNMPYYSSSLVTLKFLITNDIKYDCYSSPVKFYWDNGDDNTFYIDNETYRITSAHIFDEEPIEDPIFENDKHNPLTGYPTYYGAQDIDCCENPEQPTFRDLQLFNDYVDFVCVDSFINKCDLNLNSIPFEVSDLLLYINFFVYGLSVFDINVEGQIAYSDVNSDGLVLSIPDLQLLMNIVLVRNFPYPKPSIAKTNLVNHSGTLSIPEPMAAAFIKTKGDISPTLLADNMQMQYHFDKSANETRILIYNMTESNQTFVGDFLDIGDAEINYIEMTTYDAQKVEVTIQPTTFTVSQNYPNPFNPTTTISFTLPHPGEVSLSVYNINGQLLETKTKSYESAGDYNIEWDGTNYSSGIYFYKLAFDNFEQTKKMILIK